MAREVERAAGASVRHHGRAVRAINREKVAAMIAAIDQHGLGRLTRILMLTAICVSLLHHVDHVLRVDHSGWPFKPVVTPFTFSLLAYPVVLFGLFGPRRLFWLRWTLLAAATGFTLYAHSVVETPWMQYAMWAQNCSADPAAAGVTNLLDLQSPGFGLVAVAISMLLNLLAVASTVSMLADGFRGE
jgi:hypothetical protein